MELQKNLELKKHVCSIHSSNSLTLVQRKIANGLLFNAYADLLDKDEHSISIKDLCKLIGYDSNDYKTIKSALVNLLSTVVEWNLVDREAVDKTGAWNASSIIADASIENSLCTYSYSKRMRQLLHRPEIYGRLNMGIQAKFKSSYGLALYENCIRYQNLDYTPWFDYLVFRKLMGVEENKYLIFRDFKRRVLDKAVTEVNSYAPINITVNVRKSNRQIASIRFLIKRNIEKKQDFINNVSTDLSVYLISNFGFSAEMSMKVINKYGDEYIREKITIIESSKSFQNGDIVNLTMYLTNALEKDYKPGKSSPKRLGQKQVVTISQQDKVSRQALEERRSEYDRFVYKSILEKYKILDEDEKRKIATQFENYLGEGGFLDVFRKEGLINPIIADKFCLFMKISYSPICMSIITFEEFLKLHSS